jgi:hypothetical protein
MKILFFRLFSRISHFLIESNFKSCKKISLEISLNFFVKTQHFSKETGRPEKNLQFKMQIAQLCYPLEGWSESTCPGLSNVICHIGVPGRACL